MKVFSFHLLVFLNSTILYNDTTVNSRTHKSGNYLTCVYLRQNLRERSSWPHISPVVGEEPLFNSLRVGTDARLSPKIDKE